MSEPVTTVAEVLREIVREHGRFLTSADDARGRAFAKCAEKARAAILQARAQEDAVRALRAIMPLAEYGAKVMAANPGSHQEFIREDADTIVAAQAVLARLTPQTTPEEK